MRPGSSVDLKCVHLDCTWTASFVVQHTQDETKTQHILRTGCLHSVVWLLLQTLRRAGQGGHIQMPAAVPEGKCTQKSWKSRSELLISNSHWSMKMWQVMHPDRTGFKPPQSFASSQYLHTNEYSTAVIFLETRYLWCACYEPAIVLVTDPHALSALTQPSRQVF